MRFRFEWRTVSRMLARPLNTARGPLTRRDSVLVRLESPEGDVGFGEAAPLEAFGTESLEDVQARFAALGSAPDADELGAVEAGLPCARFAVETAMVSLRGLRLLPPVRQRSLPVCGLADLWRPFDEDALRLAGLGHATLKFKIATREVGEEIARVERLLSVLPRDILLRLDANGGLDRGAAERLLSAAAEWPLEFVEQPLAPGDFEGLVALARRFPGRVAVEESVSRSRDLALLARAGWEGPVVVKPSLLGTVVLWTDAWARYNWPWVFSSALETRIGCAHALGIAFALSREPRALGFGVGGWLPEDGLGGGVDGPSIEWTTLSGWSLADTWEAA